MTRQTSDETRVHGDLRIEIESDFGGLWTVDLWHNRTHELLEHRAQVVDTQVEETVAALLPAA